MLSFIITVAIASILNSAGFIDSLAVAPNMETYQTNAPLAPKRLPNSSLGMATTARQILVVDQATGSVLYRKGDDNPAAIASVTKLMTALVFAKTNPDWLSEVELLPEDRREGGLTYIYSGEVVTVTDLFKAMMIASSNESAAAIARISGHQDFIAAMNSTATELGMSNTIFVDPTGLDSGNVSTPTDLIKLLNAALEVPEIAEVVTTDTFEFEIINNGRTQFAQSTDLLLSSFLNRDPYKIIGAKTGYLEEAGYCLVITVEKDGRQITAVLLGAQTITDRWQEAKGVIDWVFRSYEW